MSFQDIFRKSFLEGWVSTEIGVTAAIVTMLVTGFLSLYIFFFYRIVTKKTFYNKSFNISLTGVSIITAAIILTIQSSIVISLGMVGALSIIRFRTAIKDPMDLMFLFWAISIGIICGAGLAEIAVILSIVLTIGLLILDRLPIARAPMILVVNAADLNAEQAIMNTLSSFCKYPRVKSRNMTPAALDLTIELRTDRGSELVHDVMALNGINAVSLLSHDGEVTF